ncbi:MAG: hypothetical protein PVI41_01515, partial [Roseobacter sp.]
RDNKVIFKVIFPIEVDLVLLPARLQKLTRWCRASCHGLPTAFEGETASWLPWDFDIGSADSSQFRPRWTVAPTEDPKKRQFLPNLHKGKHFL